VKFHLSILLAAKVSSALKHFDGMTMWYFLVARFSYFFADYRIVNYQVSKKDNGEEINRASRID